MPIRRIVLPVLCGLLLCGCAAQQLPPKPTGFLVNYSKLSPGKEGQMGLRYVNPDFRLANYDAILVSRVQTWLKGEGQDKNIDADTLHEMVRYFEDALMREVGKHMPVTDTLGPRVLVLRVGITGIETAAATAAAPVSPATITPAGAVRKKAAGGAADDAIRVNSASMEMELLDGVTFARLAASVDKRGGSAASSRSALQEALDAFDFWAALIGQRIGEGRAK